MGRDGGGCGKVEDTYHHGICDGRKHLQETVVCFEQRIIELQNEHEKIYHKCREDMTNLQKQITEKDTLLKEAMEIINQVYLEDQMLVRCGIWISKVNRVANS